MRQYLKTILDCNEDVENILMCIQELCEVDMGLEDALDILGEEGLQFEKKKDLNAFISFYQELNDHTRKCVNRGYTPVELRQTKPITGQITMFEDD